MDSISDRLQSQIDFIVEVDKLKQIVRRSYLTDGSRLENDAEHSWHLALMTLILGEHSDKPDLDIVRVLGMVLVHDLVEIDAGDAILYDTAARQAKVELEKKAAERIFPILPADQAAKLRGLWDEFEAGLTPEARFARALDRLQPLLLSKSSGGRQWRENRVTFEMTMKINPPVIEGGAPALGEYAKELLMDAERKGLFGKPESKNE